jgi:uncharacterized protein YfaS (alpha-2-macroglobulin family)
LALALLVCLACLAQFQTRTVAGLVTDKRGNALPNSTVELENTVTLSVMSAITDKHGHYHFSGLNSDIDYLLRAKYRSYWAKPKTLSKFTMAPHPEVDLVVPIE